MPMPWYAIGQQIPAYHALLYFPNAKHRELSRGCQFLHEWQFLTTI